jgi:hypothetical protein
VRLLDNAVGASIQMVTHLKFLLEEISRLFILFRTEYIVTKESERQSKNLNIGVD